MRKKLCLPLPPPLKLPDVVWVEKSNKAEDNTSEIEMMRERFAKLLLGEDMSGGGKGVCTALAISNAITNLSATVFGQLWKLEPLAPQKKSMWCREMDWLLSVSDWIVELVPSVQEFPGGGTYEVMVSQPRPDLCVNLPALKKLDAMLLSILDGFRGTEFWYVDRGIVVADPNADDYRSPDSDGRPSFRQEEKWWLPCPKVPLNGLSAEARKRLEQRRDCTNQILKAAMAINSSVLAEMEIPISYLETLPKSGRSCLGDTIHRYITANHFNPESLLDCLNLSKEHYAVQTADMIEGAIHVWRRKDQKINLNNTKSKNKSWGKVKGLVSNDAGKNQYLVQRAETLLYCLRRRFPGLPQTTLDMSKIQYNTDVGHAILESYSRVMESLAFNVMARIDDLLYVDDTTKRAEVEAGSLFGRGGLGGLPIRKRMSPSPFTIHQTPHSSHFATPTLCSSTPISGSPKRTASSTTNSTSDGVTDLKTEGLHINRERMWTYASQCAKSTRKCAPERD